MTVVLPAPPIDNALVARLYLNATKRDAGYRSLCFEYDGPRYEKGYGYINIDGVKYLVHRVAWTIFDGDPGHLLVCHHCDNPPCIRRSHLFLGTNAENLADMSQKGRGKPSALTQEDLLLLRKLRDEGASQRDAGARVGITQSMVSYLERNGRI